MLLAQNISSSTYGFSNEGRKHALTEMSFDNDTKDGCMLDPAIGSEKVLNAFPVGIIHPLLSWFDPVPRLGCPFRLFKPFDKPIRPVDSDIELVGNISYIELLRSRSVPPG